MTAFDRLKRWNFWRKALGRHGVHSPFIYGFLDKGLYRRDLKKYPPQKRLLLAAADHFGARSAMACPAHGPMAEWLGSERPALSWSSVPADLIICDTPGDKLLAFLGRPELWQNDTVVFTGNLRRDDGTYAHWVQAAAHPAVRVVLETYPAGLLFFRTQQARQHFRIRI